MSLEDDWVISVLASALPCKRSSSPRNWNKLSSQMKHSHQQFTNNAWLIHFHETCPTRIMLATRPDIFTSAFSNTIIQRLAYNFWRPVGAYVIWMKINFVSFANGVQSIITLCTRCCLPNNAIHAGTQWPIPFVQDSLLKIILTHWFAFTFNQV